MLYSSTQYIEIFNIYMYFSFSNNNKKNKKKPFID